MLKYCDKFTILAILISSFLFLILTGVYAFYLHSFSLGAKTPLLQLVLTSLRYVSPLIITMFGIFLLYIALTYPALKIIYSSQFNVEMYVQLDKYLHKELYLKYLKEFHRLFYPQHKYVGFIILITSIVLVYILFTFVRFITNNPYTSMMIVVALGPIIFPGTLLSITRAYVFVDVIVSFAEKGCKNSSELPQHVKQAIIALGLCNDVSKYFIDNKVTSGSTVLIVILISILSILFLGAKTIESLIETFRMTTVVTVEDIISALVSILLYAITFVMSLMYYAFIKSTLFILKLAYKSGRLGGTSTLARNLRKEVYNDIAIPIIVLFTEIIATILWEGELPNFITLLFRVLLSLSLAAVAYYFEVLIRGT